MLKLSEIRRVRETLGDDWRSPFADRMAEPWGIEPGECRFWRSSASHVFIVTGNRYLKAVPAWHRTRAAMEAVVRVVTELAGTGVRVAAFHDNPIKTVGGYHVMLLEGAPGHQIEAEELDAPRARAWGAALAGLHSSNVDVSGLESAFTVLDDAAECFPSDPELVAAIADMAARLARLPRDSSRYGLTHGDFELDNLSWVDDQPTAFDFDEIRLSWFVDDIAKATGEIDGSPHFDDFLAGYRGVRPLPASDLADLPLLRAARAAESLIRLHNVSDDDSDERLVASVARHLRRQRAVVLA